MPNFLSSALGAGNSILSQSSGAFDSFGFDAKQASNIASAAQTALGALGLGGGGGIGGLGGGAGSKPKALHTEYAEEDASWSKPYGGGEDIVFYFQRADQTSGVTDSTNGFGGDQQSGQGPGFNGQANSLTTNALGTNVGGVESGAIPSNVMGGNNTLLSKVQSGFNQVAAVSSAAVSVGSSLGANVGPISNLNKGLSTATSVLGIASSLTSQGQQQTIAAGLGRVIPGAKNTPNQAASTTYWDTVSNDSFNVGSDGRSPFTPTSEFSGAMAKASGGVDSSTFLSDSAANGDLFTTPDSLDSTAMDFGKAAAANPGGLAGGGGSGGEIPSEWYFITAPQDVSWGKDSNAKALDVYGSNTPYMSYSTTKMRKLTLGNALVEGFSNAKAVENNIIALEACMQVIINVENGYASPYCWNVFAGDKSYGTFLITAVNVKEQMRDMTGKATRAVVDIEFQEVPSYQVSSGNDLAAEGNVAVSSEALEKYKAQQAQQAGQQDRSVAGKQTGGAGAGSGGGPSDPNDPAYTGPQTGGGYQSGGYEAGYEAGRRRGP